jgi:isoquinoline 1-oxidoreductase beta subunit
VEGIVDTPYGVPNQRVEYVMKNTPVPVGFWRSVGHSQNAFFMESFVDEIAHAGGHDPVEFRLSLLASKPRHRAVVERAAAAAGWGKPSNGGRFLGFALHESFGSIVAEVAEISLDKGDALRVQRVTCAVDCGRCINPDTVKAQLNGAVAFGLTAALFGEITVSDGKIEQENFDTYKMLLLSQMPQIEVQIIESGEKLGGIGEVGTPPIAPALANAVFAATATRVRSLPLSRHGISVAQR